MGLAPNYDLDPRAVLAVVGATVGMALSFGSLAFTSVFMQPLEQAFGWSRAEVRLGYGIAAVGMAVGGLVWGRLSDRLNIRILLAIGGAGMVLALLAMGAASIAILAAAAFMCCTCMGVPLVHLASFVGTLCGSPELGATSLLVAMLSATVGHVCFGIIADRMGYLPSYALASAIQTCCVLAYPLLGGGASLLTLSAVFGFGFAGNMICLVLCVRETVAASHFGGALGKVMLVAWAGMGAGGYAGGLLFDAFASYGLSFALAGAAGGLNLVALLTLAHVRRRPGAALAT